MPKRDKDPIGFLKIAKVCYGTVFRVAPVYFSMQQVIAVAHGISWGLGVLVSQKFFDSVAASAQAGGEQISSVLWMFAAFVLMGITQQVLNGVHNFMHGVLFPQLQGEAKQQIHRKSSRIPAIIFEDPDKLDDINKAEKGADSLYDFLMTVTTLFTFYLPYFLFMAFYLYSVSWMLTLSILLAFVPCMVSQLVNTRILAKLEDESAPIRRASEAHEKAIVDRAYLKETRLLGAFAYFKRRYLESVALLNRANIRAKGKAELIGLGLNILSMLAYGAVIGMLILLLMRGEITPGSFAAVYYSMSTVFGIMDEIVVRHLGGLTKNYGSIRNFIRFVELPEIQGEDGSLDMSEGIRVRDASFRYPNAGRDSLRGVTLDIRPGETIAIVGENGSGKTTLVRLLTGLYTPTEGSVLVGGLDTQTCAPRSLYARISGVFQKYQRYSLSLEENVLIARTEVAGSVKPVLDEVGVSYGDQATFPAGLDTVLSREFDGTDLSGGQWQRIAIARGFYRDGELIVLDEPTAAIDPIEESRIYRQFAQIAKGKTCIIVTHRMGSARIADRIVVVADGQIAQVGTHDELIATDGAYKAMYDAQAEWYSELQFGN